MKIFIFAEREKALREMSLGARQLGGQVEMIAVGEGRKAVAGADKIWFIPEQPGAIMEDYKDTIAALIMNEKPDMVLVEPTKRCKVIAGQLAALLGTSVIPDVIEISAGGEARRLVYGGTAIRREKARGKITIAMIGPGVLPVDGAAPGKSEIETVEFIASSSGLKRTGTVTRETSGVDLPSAKRVIGVGRGIAKQEDLAVINELARAIGGEVGCTRPIAEAEHWMPRELYIGVSGLMLAPEVYLAVGVSGQVQHTVGIDRAKVVIAINNDKNAPIFKQSDYGIVGDLYKVVPALTAAMQYVEGCQKWRIYNSMQ